MKIIKYSNNQDEHRIQIRCTSKSFHVRRCVNTPARNHVYEKQNDMVIRQLYPAKRKGKEKGKADGRV